MNSVREGEKEIGNDLIEKEFHARYKHPSSYNNAYRP